MAQLNLQVNLLSFYDNTASNNPYLRAFDFTLKLAGIDAKNPDQRPYSVPPQSTQVVYDGTRTVSIDGTTQFDVTKPYLDKDMYRFAWNSSGTAPVFRTDRGLGLTTSSAFNLTVNGPVCTITSTAGPFVTTNIQVGDVLNIIAGAGTSNANQGRFTIIAKTATSISFQNINAAAESFTILDADLFLVYSHGGSNNQIQIGDKVKISNGFSIASFGTYEVAEVTPEWFEVLVGSPNGLPLESAIIPTASGLVFYKEAKKFVMVAAQQEVAIRFNDDTTDSTVVEPVEPNNPEKAGLLLKNGSFYKLVISNTGLTTANIIIATVG